MAAKVLTDAYIVYGGHEIGQYSNDATVNAERESVEVTNFGSAGWKEFLGGLKNAQVGVQGFDDNATLDPDDEFWTQPSNVPFTMTQEAAPPAEGDLAYGVLVSRVTYTRSATVGSAAGFSLSLQGAYPTVRGIIDEHQDTIVATGNSTGTQLGAVTAATDTMWAFLHVRFAGDAGGDTLDVTIESDDNAPFASATTRMTFTQVLGNVTDAKTFEAKSVAGPITDDYWRTVFTIGGGTPDFDITVFLGIGVGAAPA